MRTPTPPRFAEWILERVVPKGVVGKSMLGDAREEYAASHRREGARRANRKYWLVAFSVLSRFWGRAPTRRPSNTPPTNDSRKTRNALASDLRSATRLLLRRPGLTAIAIVSLGLGIGANTAIFSLVNTILLRPLPYPESEELVEVFRIDENVTGFDPAIPVVSGLWAVPYEVHLDWFEMSSVFAAGGAYAGGRTNLQGDDGPTGIQVGLFTSGVFSALRTPPTLGRFFLPEDDAVGAPQVAVLSHALWRTRFGEDREILGQQLDLDGDLVTVVGVMPAGFGFPDPSYQLWISFPDEYRTSPVRNGGYLKVLARMAPGITLDQARREMAQVAARIGEAHPAEAEHGIGLFRQKDLLVAGSRSGLLISLGAVALVLLIACTNIAGLFLVRATEKRREIGVRRALGASGHRLVLQQMSESLILSLLGGAVGLSLAVFGMDPFLALMPSDLPRLGEIEVHSGLLLTALALSVTTGILTGFLPAIRSARTPITSVLREGGRSLAGGRSRNRAQAGLVVSQIALAFVLLTGAGLFIRSMLGLMAVEPGFEAGNTLVAGVGVPEALMPDRSEATSPAAWEAVFTHYREVEERLRALPGVEEVGAANQMPFRGGWSAPPATTETADGPTDGILHVATVTPSYFPTLDIPLMEGRLLSEDDGAASEPVTVVSRSLAERLAPDGSPLGLRIRVNSRGDSIWRTVVGVVGDVRYRLDWPVMRMAYVPVAQRPNSVNNWVIRTGTDPVSLVSTVRGVADGMNPGETASVRVLMEVIGESSAMISARFSVILLGSLAGLAGFLALLGVYGVLAYTVQLRSHEIGISLAIGADPTRVMRTFLFRGLRMAGIGLGAGSFLSLILGKVLEAELFGVRARDPVTYLLSGALMAVAVLAASYIPARRAAGLDPVEVMKGE